jgi:hypothetical protein
MGAALTGPALNDTLRGVFSSHLKAYAHTEGPDPHFMKNTFLAGFQTSPGPNAGVLDRLRQGTHEAPKMPLGKPVIGIKGHGFD